MEITGHRGARGLERENTISSFKKAQELGVDEIEMDLRATKDKYIVVHHDEDLLRTHHDPRKISEIIWEELQILSQKVNYPTPLLKEVLDKIHMPLNLEVKETGFEQRLLEEIKGFPSKVLISSFKLGVLRKIRALDRNIKIALIISPKRNYLYIFLFPFFRSLRFYSINLRHDLITSKRIKFIHNLEMKIMTWVINDINQFEIMKEMGVDGIGTDYPNIIHN